MLHSGLHTLMCMIIESSRILESLLACLTGKNHPFFLVLRLELIRKFLEMNTDEMDESISLTNIFIIASLTRALERLLCFKSLRMLKFHMNIKNTLLRKPLGAMLTCMRKNSIMASKMIVHRRLIFSCKVAMIANEFSVAVLNIHENHL
jgi:hypothetical protein